MAFSDACARLAALSYSGLTTSYAIDELPVAVNDLALPALLVLPEDTFVNAVRPFDAALTYGEVEVFVRHVLLVSGAGQGRVEDRYAALAGWVNTYVDTITGDPYLNGNLQYPATVQMMQFGFVEYGGVLYQGIEFLHKWVLKV